jgi:surfactin synthase thioesterase subunit
VTTSLMPRPTNGDMMDVAAASSASADRWFVRHAPRPQARTHLYCFPWSGAASTAYRRWAAGMPDDIELISIALPGRYARVDEPVVDRIEPLADDIAAAIVGQPACDIAFFGHSFGALLAYAVAIRLRGTAASPSVLIASASRAPWVRPPIVLHELSDQKLVEMLVRLGIAAGKATDWAFLERFLPLVRADLRACESYHVIGPEPVDWRMRTWAATEDWYASPQIVHRWRGTAGAEFTTRVRPGGHFSVREDTGIISTLLEDLRDPDALPIAA